MRQTLLWWLACAAMAAQAAQPQLIPWLGADGRYGYVNDAGQMRIPPRYDDVRQFFDGRAAARLGGRWGYLDTGGHWVVAPRYTEAKDFGPDGKATALIHTDAIKVGSGFLAMTMVKQHYHYEQLDRAGQVVKSWDTDNGPMGPPRAGSTMVPTPIAALVRSGKYLFGADLASLYALTGSGCGVQGGICKMHLFDATGQQVSSRAFYLTRSQEFGDGRMAMLCADNGKHGYVDEKGALVIPCLYDGAGLFSRRAGDCAAAWQGQRCHRS